MTASGDLKHATYRLTAAEADIRKRKATIAEEQRALAEQEALATALRNEVQSLTRDSLTVSEHALLRYVERVMLIPVHNVETGIIEKLTPMFKTLGNGTFPLIDGFTAKIVNGVVVTIIPTNGK